MYLSWYLSFFTQAGVWQPATKSICISISVSFLVRALGEPAECPCGPVERGYVERIPCPDTKQLAGSV